MTAITRIMTLKTPRLRLRQWTEDDLAPFAEMSADAEVMRYFPGTLSADESTRLVERFAEGIRERGWGFWAVELIESGAFIGLIGLHPQGAESGIPDSPLIEVGWRIARPYWRRGYAEEGAREAMRFAFEMLRCDALYAFTVVNNHPSRQLMVKLGMRDTGHDFDHPKLPIGHRLRRHCLYVTTRM